MPFAFRRALVAACAALCCGAAFADAAKVPAADAGLLAAARAAQPALEQSLRDMVAIESGSANAAGLAQMADYTERRLIALGARTERFAATRGPGTLVQGTLVGTGKRRILLIAHMDTVYPANTLATQPIRREGNRLYGPGIADDKGGIAVILHSLEILKARGWRDYAQLSVLFNPDEEVGSGGSGERIAALADQHDVVLSFEPSPDRATAGAEGVLLAASGTATATLTIKGRASHAGAAPEQGRNALLELAYQLQQTRDVAKDVPGTQLNWTSASADGPRNQIPETASAGADVRISVPGGAQKLEAALQQKVGAGHLVPDTQATVTMSEGRPAYVADARGQALARRAQQIYAELDGRKLLLIPGTGGGTDAGFAARSGKAAVLESLGLAGHGYHARDEYVDLEAVVPRLYLVTRLLEEIGRE